MSNRFLARLRTALVKTQGSATYSWLKVILLTSVCITTLVLGVRQLKWLQAWELGVYDLMLRSRLPEPPDNRILLVTITQQDLAREKGPLPDQTINKLLAKLELHHPRVVGLNLFQPHKTNLVAPLQPKEYVIGTCLLSNKDREEIPPPQNFPIDQIGFNDVVTDSETDLILRRALLFAHPSPTDYKCKTKFSFAALLALNYLEKQGIKYTFNQNQQLQIDQIIFPRLDIHAGSYEDIDTNGYQILLNYRHPQRLAQQVTLTDVLEDKVNPNWIKDRLVIIGITAPSFNSGYYTPYSALPDQANRMSSVFIHAQIASQILSTVLDGRPLISYWPQWVEYLWIFGWSVIGAVLASQWRHPLLFLVMEGFTLTGLVGIGAGLFLQATWIPIIPAALTLVMSGVVVMVYSHQNQHKPQDIIQYVEKQQEAIAQLSILLTETTSLTDNITENIIDQVKTTKITEISSLSNQSHSPILALEIPQNFLLAGRYKISRILGAGGFGRTYLAQDTQKPSQPTCVVKQLMPARNDTRFMDVARRLFQTEAEILEALGQHQQIPELLAYFEDDYKFYLVQEYIPGHTLSEELPPTQAVKDEHFVIDMLKNVLEVLSFVHQNRVIHRDIKPSNIIRCNQDNRLVLIDFGAVKLMQPVSSGATELATVAIGTRGYAPPEQFVGHPRLCSDIYALGIMGIQAITGIPPQELQPHPDTGNLIWRNTAKVSSELAGILDKMICYHFSDRYQSASDVLRDLKSINH
ncbi:MAG TPA: CHASE2 domain-containing serine/threonine-protein kinase [Nostocaceae cyanobacterium]|nr:CHASE2 domain-containing serine/threonine-protein kinase [Nostocaceae cyanobacterium]